VQPDIEHDQLGLLVAGGSNTIGGTLGLTNEARRDVQCIRERCTH